MTLRGRLHCAGALALGRRWRAHLREIEASRPEEIERRALTTLLPHALDHVPYYRDLGIPAASLSSFPLLSREALRTEFARLKSDDLARRRPSLASTGGSTGEPVWVIHDRGFQQWDVAAEMYCFDQFFGMSPREYLRSRRVAIWHQRRLRAGTGLAKRLAVRILGQVLYVEPYRVLSDDRMTEVLRRINRHRPEVILAFAGTAFELAKHARQVGIRMHSPRFVATSVETLFPMMRETIGDVFRCRVHNRYGAAEVGRIAAECSHGNLHLVSFANHVEVLGDDGAPVGPGQVGRVVVTSLHNLAMPLIRYDIGDLVRTSASPCSCGHLLPTVDEIQGRVIHHFVRPDGSLVFGGNFVAMFYEHDWIIQFHVLQEDVDRIRISYKRRPGSSVPPTAMERMTTIVRDLMGEGCRVLWEEVDAVPASPLGRRLHTRSLVWEEKIGGRITPGDDAA